MLPGRTKAEGDAIRATKAIEQERAAIFAELDALDKRSARAIRAVVAGIATDEDKDKLTEIETMARELRKRLSELEIETIG